MKKTKWFFCIVTFLLLFGSAEATRINPLSIEEQISKADLIALAKVEAAGGFYTKFKIIKSVKGDPKDSVILYTPPGPHGPFFPHDLVGELHVIYAYKNSDPTRIMSTSSASANILTNRKLAYDYRLPLWQGKYLVKDEKEGNQMLEYAGKFLKKPTEERESFFLKEGVAKSFGSLKVRGPTAGSQLLRTVVFSDDKDQVMSDFKLIPEKIRIRTGLQIRGDDKITFDMIKERRERIRFGEPTKYDLFSIETDDKKVLAKWPSLKKDLMENHSNSNDNYHRKRVQRIEDNAKEKANSSSAKQKRVFDIFRPFLKEKPTNLAQLEKKMMDAKPHEIGFIFRVYKKWGLSFSDKALAHLSMIAVKDQVKQGKGHVNNAIWHLFEFPVPKNAAVLAEMMRKTGDDQDVSSKWSLLAFYGDRDARKKIEERLSKVSKYNDYRHNEDRSIVASSDIFWEHEAVLNYNETFLLEIAEKNEFIRPKLLILLSNRGSDKALARITPLFDKLPPEQKVDVLSRIDIQKHLDLFKRQYSGMKPEEKLKCLLEICDRQSRFPDENKKFVDNEVAPRIAEVMRENPIEDQRSIIRSLWLLAVSGHPDCGEMLEKYYKRIGESHRRSDGLPYILTSLLAQSVKDRALLVPLTKSESEDIKTTALIYLTILDEDKYAPMLEKQVKGDSLINARAAVVLAERGRTDSFSGLLKLLAEKNSEGRDYRMNVIQQRVDILLSNATQGKTNGMDITELSEYWEKNKDKIKLRDPWRETWDKCFCE